MYWELSEQTRLAQRMLQRIVLGPGKFSLVRGYQQKNCLSYLGLAIQPRLAIGSSARG